MNAKEIFKVVREKKMDRKDFLKYVGLFLLSIVGLKTFAGLLMESGDYAVGNTTQPNNGAGGYGSSKYGK